MTTVFHFVELGQNSLVVVDDIHDVVRLFAVHAALVQELLEVIHLSDLTGNRQGFGVLVHSGLVIVSDCCSWVVESLGKKQEAANDETCSSFACLAMNSDHRTFACEVFFNLAELLVGQQVAFVFAFKTDLEVHLHLVHLLNEQEHVNANVEN